MDLLSSIETEYALAALDHAGKRVNSNAVFEAFMAAARTQTITMPAAAGGVFLSNGARLYLDYGAHPEYAAPECAGHPGELIAHVQAGHAILQRIALEVEALPEVASVRIWRSNVDYWTRQTWGCHENYLTKRAVGELAKDLVPFLVTRVVYAGAGGWNPNHYGLEFSLSPRLQLFTNTISGHTTSQRPIINTRDESHSGEGYHRVHLICRDSLHSQLGD
ncbi:MAG: proteasome accessory factor PafA2 family protein, partial [Gammaproteobacteria bacterium]|nr:proteasome accessory factor PafA2 family protein [Gammaproteobacteria bacterium]